MSLRQINLASGQRNSSATQYHFGTKVGLIEALFDYRMEAINARRVELLRQIEGQIDDEDAATSLRRLVEALIFPLAEQVKTQGGACNYIAIAAQANGHPNYHAIAQRRSRHGAGLQRLLTLLRQRLAGIPESLIRERFGMALRQVFNELADYQRLHPAGTGGAGMTLFVNNLVDAVTAQFAAPVSATTLQELGSEQRKTA